MSFLARKLVLPTTAILAALFTWPVIGNAYLPPGEIGALLLIIFGICVYLKGQKYKEENLKERDRCCYFGGLGFGSSGG